MVRELTREGSFFDKKALKFPTITRRGWFDNIENDLVATAVSTNHEVSRKMADLSGGVHRDRTSESEESHTLLTLTGPVSILRTRGKRIAWSSREEVLTAQARQNITTTLSAFEEQMSTASEASARLMVSAAGSAAELKLTCSPISMSVLRLAWRYIRRRQFSTALRCVWIPLNMRTGR